MLVPEPPLPSEGWAPWKFSTWPPPEQDDEYEGEIYWGYRSGVVEKVRIALGPIDPAEAKKRVAVVMANPRHTLLHPLREGESDPTIDDPLPEDDPELREPRAFRRKRAKGK